MNKRLVIFGVLLAALLLSAVSPWPAILTVYNFTGDNIYFTLKYRGEQKYFLTATNDGNSATYHLSRFDIVRREYTSQVTACSTTTGWARMTMTSNLRLNFVGCDSMKQFWTPKFWGEPTMEKPNFWSWDFQGLKPGIGSRAAYAQHVPENDTWFGGYTWGAGFGSQHFRFLYDVSPLTSCWNDSKKWPNTPDVCP